MPLLQTYHALGLSCGSELDGINASVIVTDGVDVFAMGQNFEFPFNDDLRDRLRTLHNKYPHIDEKEKQEVESEFTAFCISVVQEILETDSRINLLGFGGYILCHKPNEHILCQIGDNAKIAKECRLQTVGCLRDADILSGGRGAPLAAIYHMALSQKLDKPVVWVDIGGVSALTYIGCNGEMSAFDTGAGNALINDWVNKHANMHTDYNGRLAISGHVHDDVLSSLMRHKFLSQLPPKVAQKNTFDEKSEHLEGLSLEDGAATATAFVAESIVKAINDFIADKPQKVIICGAGAQNPTLMRFLRHRAEAMEICCAEDFGYVSTAIEAQAFAFLAVRRCNRMPTSYPFTTGAPTEVIGGEIYNIDS